MPPFLERLAGATLAAVCSGHAIAAEEKGPTEPAYLYRAQVVGIVDRDTVDVDIDLGFYITFRNQRVRLVGIDAPEARGETREAGEVATKCLRDLIDGQTVIIRTIRGKDGGDRDDSFGRWLGEFYLDGLNVNDRMVESKCAVRDERK